MAASFPGSVKSFGSDRITGDFIPASDTNDLRAEVVAMETALLTGGWITDPTTWTYASASTFTVAGDKTAIYEKSTRLKFTQSAAVKYAIVLSSSYSAGSGLTTVTIFVNTSYTIANAVISAQAYSNLAVPRGWPEWFNYTPTTSGLTTTGGTLAGKYRVVGKKIDVSINFTLGVGSAVTGSVTFSLPQDVVTANMALAWLQDTGTNTYAGLVTLFGTTLTLYAINTASTYMSVSALSATVPYTWASTDWMRMVVSYDLA